MRKQQIEVECDGECYDSFGDTCELPAETIEKFARENGGVRIGDEHFRQSCVKKVIMANDEND